MFHDVSILFMLYKIGEVFYNQIRTYGFAEKRNNKRFTAFLSMLSSKPENWSFYVVVLTSTGEKCTKMLVAPAAPSFFPLLWPV